MTMLCKCIRKLFVSTDSNVNNVAEFGELSFRAISPALSNNRGSQCSQVNITAPHPSLTLY